MLLNKVDAGIIDMELTIYLGWDSREVEAYEVCVHSILQRCTNDNVELKIVPLIQPHLRSSGHYYRPIDKKAATEFSLTRFLVPALNEFRGTAIFADCDFLFLSDISAVLNEVTPDAAVSVVQHDYRPSETMKMDGAQQFNYPRKNWSSFIVFNCAHPSNRALTLETVNEATPQFLHRFSWLQDSEIGNLPETWNYLEGWYDGTRSVDELKAIHFTRGGPWFSNMQDVDFADLWIKERDSFKAANSLRLKTA